MDGAKVLRDASYNNYLGIDPDAPDDEFTTTLVEDGGEFKAEEENFSLADMEFGTGEPGVVAFPFVRPAMDANLTAMDKAIAENIQNQIKASIG